ncbi:MAG TPA: hypothetical protein PLJ35_09345 [Anaerolineae bacterium]|nr:hypothetical protein [Anaerolineae bacterium]HOQ99014.1 hypothetical protein [Anaerolineae bacterium]HPL28859.1 hypothetical protein [Anaerolineae bacterium]
MSLPGIVLSFAIASLYAGLFHFAFARRAAEVVRYWAVAIGGFAVGALVGLAIPWQALVVGQVHVLEGSAACIAALFLTRWLQGARRARP